MPGRTELRAEPQQSRAALGIPAPVAKRSALARAYTHAMQVSLVFNLAAVALACLLASFFPRRTAPADDTASKAGSAA
jgi:hypothetical protein